MNRRIAGLIAASLVLGSLTPTAFAANKAPNHAFRASIALDGKTVSQPYGFIASDGSNLTTFMPMYYIDQVLAKAGYQAKWDGHTWAITNANANPDLSGLQVGSGNTVITVNGQVVKKINTMARKDPAGGKHAVLTTYVPVWYVQPLLEAVGIQTKWDGVHHIWMETSPVTVKAGSYGPSTGTQEIHQNLVITGTGVTVQNVKVDGNIYINPGANGTVHLDNVTATGSIVVLSGASHSVYLDGVTSPLLEIASASDIHIVVQGNTQIGQTNVAHTEQHSVTLEQQAGSVGEVTVAGSGQIALTGSFDSVTVTGGATIEIPAGSKVGTLRISGSNVTLQIDQGATVNQVAVDKTVGKVAITNNGTITTLVNNSNSDAVSLSGSGTVTTTEGNAPGGTTTGGGGGAGGVVGGGGGGGNSNTLNSEEQQTLDRLVQKLNTLHETLQTNGTLAKVQAAELAEQGLSTSDWDAIVFGTGSANSSVTTAVKDIVNLATFSNFADDTKAQSEVLQAVADLQQVNSGVTVDGLYNLYLKFKDDLIAEFVTGTSSSQSGSGPVSSALSMALAGTPISDSSNTTFAGALRDDGVDVSAAGLSAIDGRLQAKIGQQTFTDAVNALTQAAASKYLVPVQPISLTAGETTTLPTLTFNSDAPAGLDGFTVLSSMVTWTSLDTTIASVSNGQVVGIKAGTATLTASVDGYTVVRVQVTVQ
ncbi:MAG: hypothetical protein K6T78_11610 [Alicyclobacillus sp.]|nr:hypothetical protein [Alicyclobacillus sp.]